MHRRLSQLKTSGEAAKRHHRQTGKWPSLRGSLPRRRTRAQERDTFVVLTYWVSDGEPGASVESIHDTQDAAVAAAEFLVAQRNEELEDQGEGRGYDEGGRWSTWTYSDREYSETICVQRVRP